MEPKIKEKRWTKDFEEPIRKKWREERVYAFHSDDKKPVFSIDTPPPYVNTPIHIGHATVYTIMDMIARFKRMSGYNVLFPLGLDRNGLPIEVAAEKKFNISVSETPREKFIWLCKKMLEQSSLESLESFYKLGHSYNSWKPGEKPGDMYYTDSYSYRALTQATFIELWKKGLIYEDTRVNNYCPDCKTTIADAEIEYKNIETEFVYVKWKVKETGEEIIIGTTRPELLCACKMVIYNPKDDRYQHLEGKTAVVPLYETEVPIKAHPYAKIEEGTGLVMMCSFGDYTDVRFFREMGLEPVFAINQDGKMNQNAGFLQGLEIEKAREKIKQELEKKGLVVKRERTKHRTPICERSKTPIEFIAMPEYYLKQLEFKEEVIKNVADKIKFYAPSSKQILLDWINTLSADWAVSRRRYYATEIPLWYCKNCGEIVVPEPGKYYKPWKENPPIEKCPKCGGKEFKGEERVFDTWFDSSVSPLYILGYKTDEKFFRNVFPCSLRPQGKEIVRTWLYYTLLRCYQLTQKPVFQNVWIHFHVVDEHGKKMSKSLGNVIDPREIIEKYGAEAFRAWCALEGNITNIDLRCSFERIEGASKFLTKLWNIARFISMFDRKSEETLTDLDKLILHELSKLVKYTREQYENFDFHKPMARIKHFIWELFASHYIELVKNRVYNQEGFFSKQEQNSAAHTLYTVLDTLLLLLYPVLPFITTKIYSSIEGKDMENRKFPEPDENFLEMNLPFTAEDVIELNSEVWKTKKEKGVSLKSEIKKLVIPESFKAIEKDILRTHKPKEIEYGEKIEVFV